MPTLPRPPGSSVVGGWLFPTRVAVGQLVLVTAGRHQGEHGRVRFVRALGRRAVVSLRSGRSAVIPVRNLEPL